MAVPTLTRKGRQGRLTIVHPTLGNMNVPVRAKNSTHESPSINITTTESPAGEPQYDDEGGLPNREITFTIPLYAGIAQPFWNGESYNFLDYVGSKQAADADSGRLTITNVSRSGDEAEGDGFITLEYTALIGSFVKATRAVTQIDV